MYVVWGDRQTGKQTNKQTGSEAGCIAHAVLHDNNPDLANPSVRQ